MKEVLSKKDRMTLYVVMLSVILLSIIGWGLLSQGYNQYLDRFNQSLTCDAEYNQIVEEVNKSIQLSKDYSEGIAKLITKSRECEGLWLQVKLLLEDNKITTKWILTETGEDYYEKLSDTDTQIKWLQEERKRLIPPFN